MATMKTMMAEASKYMPKPSMSTTKMVGTTNPSGHSMPTKAKAYGLNKSKGWAKVGFKGKKVI